MIEPKYFHCSLWEDYKNGMMREIEFDNDKNLLLESKKLLSDTERFYNVMKKMVVDWSICTNERLTKLDTNRRAWLGWAACSYNHKSPDFITRKAWGEISEDQRNKANLIASKVILEWENDNYKKEESCQLSLWE